MTLFEQISQGIPEAMKARDKERLETLRNLKKAMLEARSLKGAGTELTDEESLRIIRKLVKQGRDSAEIYEQQHRSDLFDQEMAQVWVMEEFLPRMMNDQELTEYLTGLIARCGTVSIKEMGRVIGMANKELAGKADGKAIAEKVKSLLS